MAAQPFGCAAAALPRDRLKNVCQVTRVVTGVGHYLCAQGVGLGFVLAAIFGHPALSDQSADRSAGLSAEYRTAKDEPELPEHAFRARLFGRLRSRVPKRDVTDLVGHHTCHLTFVTCGLDHSAVDVHRTAGQSKCIQIASVHDLKSIIEPRLAELRWYPRYQSLTDARYVIRRVMVVQHRELLLDLVRRLPPEPHIVFDLVFITRRLDGGLCDRGEGHCAQRRDQRGRRYPFYSHYCHISSE